MTLREYRVWSDFDREQDDARVYSADDVDALLFEIRRLLDAERGENYTMMDYGPNRAALDALLAGGETIHQCPPDGQSITPCCGRIPFDLIGDRMATDPKLVTCRGRTS